MKSKRKLSQRCLKWDNWASHENDEGISVYGSRSPNASRRNNRFGSETESSGSDSTMSIGERERFLLNQKADLEFQISEREEKLPNKHRPNLNCPICSFNNYQQCDAPCRNSLQDPDNCPQALIVYLPRRDNLFETKLEIIFESGPQRNRFYSILRKQNSPVRQNPNDYMLIYPNEALNLGYQFINQGQNLSDQNYILKFLPNDQVYIASQLFKEIKICRSFRFRMLTNNLVL